MKNKMEKESKITPETSGEEGIKIIDGQKYQKVFSGYTLREYFSHDSEKGPGPGWDFRQEILEKYQVSDPSELPDEPYYIWEQIEG